MISTLALALFGLAPAHGLAIEPIAAAPPLASPVVKPKPFRITWKKKTYEAAEVPAELPEGALEAIAFWTPWAETNNYVAELVDDARVMFLHSAKSRKPKKQLGIIEETMAWMDATMPMPDRETSTQEASSEPDDAEGNSWSWSSEWGVVKLEHDTAVLLELDHKDDLSSLLKFLGDNDEHLRSWAASAGSQGGFVLQSPLAGAWIESGPGQEEWDPLNELVNRLGRLMMMRRFGQQPYWLTMGLAWHAELEIRDSVYCFPYRDGFVGVAEHRGWDKVLRSEYRRRDAGDLNLQKLSAWKRGSFDLWLAMRAWGTVTYLHREHPGKISAVLEELRLNRETKGRTTHADGTWTVIADYEPSLDDQLDILHRHISEDFRAQCAEFFRGGLKPSKK